MTPFSEAWLGYTWAMLWQSSLVMVVVWLLYGVSRRQSAAFRYALLCLILLKFLLPTSLESLIGVRHLWGGVEQRITTQFPAAAQLTGTRSYDITPIQEGGTHIEATRFPVEPWLVPSLETRYQLPTTLLLMWLGGVLFLATLFLIYALRVRRRFSAAVKVEDFRVLAFLEECRERMGVLRPIPLYQLAGLSSPVLAGLLYPRILISPDTLSRLSESHLRPIFLHELAHARRRDLWVNLLQIILQVVWFFHPGLWLTNWLIRRERERACDDLVVSKLDQSGRDYADSILEVLKGSVQPRWSAVGLLGIAEGGTAIRGRIRRILNTKRKIFVRVRVKEIVVLLVIGTVILPLATIERGFAQPPGKQALIEMIRDYRDKIKDIDFTYTYELDQGGPSGTIYRMKKHVVCKGDKRISEDLARWDTKEDYEKGISRGLYRKVFDGKNTMLFGKDTLSGDITPGDNQQMSIDNQIFNVLLLPPKFMDPSYTEPSVLNTIESWILWLFQHKQVEQYWSQLTHDPLLILKQHESTIVGEETLFGNKTVKVALPSNWLMGEKVMLWIDIDHGGIPRRLEKTRANTQYVIRKEISEIIESNGVAFPLTASILFQFTPTEITSTKLTVSEKDLRINSGIPDASFEFVFPPGMDVIDTVPGGATYRIDEGEPPKPKEPTPEEIAAHQPPFTLTLHVIDKDGNPKPGVRIQCRYPRWDRGEALIDQTATTNNEGKVEYHIRDVDISKDQYFYFAPQDEGIKGIKFGFSPVEDGYDYEVSFLVKDGISYLVPKEVYDSGSITLGR